MCLGAVFCNKRKTHGGLIEMLYIFLLSFYVGIPFFLKEMRDEFELTNI